MYSLESAVSRVENVIASNKLPTITLADLCELTGLNVVDAYITCIHLDRLYRLSYDISGAGKVSRLAGNQYD
jgi:hypothetical protein